MASTPGHGETAGCPTPRRGPEPTAEPGEKVVLIAVDDPWLREILRYLIEDILGARAVLGTTTEALERIHVRPFALTLLDLRPPPGGGMRLLRALRSSPATAHGPVIALTAEGRASQYNWARTAGCAACLAEPFDLDELLLAVQGYL